jgi:hypothetical protein
VVLLGWIGVVQPVVDVGGIGWGGQGMTQNPHLLACPKKQQVKLWIS